MGPSSALTLPCSSLGVSANTASTLPRCCLCPSVLCFCRNRVRTEKSQLSLTEVEVLRAGALKVLAHRTWILVPGRGWEGLCPASRHLQLCAWGATELSPARPPQTQPAPSWDLGVVCSAALRRHELTQRTAPAEPRGLCRKAVFCISLATLHCMLCDYAVLAPLNLR